MANSDNHRCNECGTTSRFKNGRTFYTLTAQHPDGKSEEAQFCSTRCVRTFLTTSGQWGFPITPATTPSKSGETQRDSVLAHDDHPARAG